MTRHVLGQLAPILVLFLAATGCARRAPGPEECHAAALAWVLGPRASLVRQLGPAAEEAVLERTTECLTAPYDAELVQCVTTGSQPRRCFGAFESRRRTRTVKDRP